MDGNKVSNCSSVSTGTNTSSIKVSCSAVQGISLDVINAGYQKSL